MNIDTLYEDLKASHPGVSELADPSKSNYALPLKRFISRILSLPSLQHHLKISQDTNGNIFVRWSPLLYKLVEDRGLKQKAKSNHSISQEGAYFCPKKPTQVIKYFGSNPDPVWLKKDEEWQQNNRSLLNKLNACSLSPPAPTRTFPETVYEVRFQNATSEPRSVSSEVTDPITVGGVQVGYQQGQLTVHLLNEGAFLRIWRYPQQNPVSYQQCIVLPMPVYVTPYTAPGWLLIDKSGVRLQERSDDVVYWKNNNTLTIGKGSPPLDTLHYTESRVSKQHLKLKRLDDHYVKLRDVSTNGTYLYPNEQRGYCFYIPDSCTFCVENPNQGVKFFLFVRNNPTTPDLINQEGA